jgi:hypothetical protein
MVSGTVTSLTLRARWWPALVRLATGNRRASDSDVTILTVRSPTRARTNAAGSRALAVTTASAQTSHLGDTPPETVRRLNVDGPTNGNLLTDSKVS